MNGLKEGLEEDFYGISFISLFIILYIIISSFITSTREYSYLTLSTFMIYYISNALQVTHIKENFDRGNYNQLIMRATPIMFFILTCWSIYSHDISNYAKLSKVVDRDNNETQEDKLIKADGYLVNKLFLIDIFMLILFIFIVGFIRLENSGDIRNYPSVSTYGPFVLIGGSIALFISTTFITLPIVSEIIEEDSTDG
tara:strand:+ start:164 stop:757 length:594 start_codon:yes stop_codon:yes gene_type:complete